MYILYKGKCEIYREIANSDPLTSNEACNQKDEVLSVILRNGVVGESAIVSEEPKIRSASCRVISDELIAFRLNKEDY